MSQFSRWIKKKETYCTCKDTTVFILIFFIRQASTDEILQKPNYFIWITTFMKAVCIFPSVKKKIVLIQSLSPYSKYKFQKLYANTSRVNSNEMIFKWYQQKYISYNSFLKKSQLHFSCHIELHFIYMYIFYTMQSLTLLFHVWNTLPFHVIPHTSIYTSYLLLGVIMHFAIQGNQSLYMYM